MELIKALLEQQPLMAMFLTISLGYLLGEINVKGFAPGADAVLVMVFAGVLLSGVVRVDIAAALA